MSELRPGHRPDLSRVAASAIALAALALGGCGQHSAHTRAPYWSTPPSQVAAAPVPVPVVVEDDGREGQLPPPRSIRHEPDDPTEPFSPNYGTAPRHRADAAPHKAAIPLDLPPAFRRQLASALGE